LPRVIVGISGGVDSSVAAYLLQQQGYDVEGLFMINWHDTTGTLAGDCPWNDDLVFAELVARKLGIKLHTIDFSEDYRKRVVDYMFSEYQRGRTPNPDVLCNREVKFDLFLDKARELGGDYVATGHYCRKKTTGKGNKSIHHLLAGTDPGKEQSYFLCQLNQQQLAPALFPVGDLHKKEVRAIASGLELPTANRKDSQGICFVGKVDLPEFLRQKLAPASGVIIEIEKKSGFVYPDMLKSDVPYSDNELKSYCAAYPFVPDDGRKIGTHSGAHFYTIGQRKGLNIGGKNEPLFILKTDTGNNILYVGQGHDHPGLNRFGLFIPAGEIHWVHDDIRMSSGEIREYKVRIRYRQPLQKAWLHMHNSGLYILFDEAQRGITPGQFAVWYHRCELLGSGVID